MGKFYPPYRGGMESTLKNLCDRAGDDVLTEVLVANDTARTVVECIDGVKVTRAGTLGRVMAVPVCPSFVFFLSRARADVIVLHEPNPVAIASYLIARPDGHVIVWFHSDIVRQRVFYAVYRPLLRWCLRLASRIVVQYPRLPDHVPLVAEFRDKTRVIPCGVDLDRFVLTREVAAHAALIRNENPGRLVLFVGRLTYYKGVEHLISAMRDVDARLLIIGRGHDAKALREQVRHHGLESRVCFLGEIGDEQLAAYYHACDVFVLPSVERSEAFGLAQVEAMACRKPVVSTNLQSGVPWVNQHEKTGLVVEPRDASALATAINRLLDDESLRSRYGAEARRRVEAEFTVEKTRTRLAGLYRELMEHASSWTQ